MLDKYNQQKITQNKAINYENFDYRTPHKLLN